MLHIIYKSRLAIFLYIAICLPRPAKALEPLTVLALTAGAAGIAWFCLVDPDEDDQTKETTCFRAAAAALALACAVELASKKTNEEALRDAQEVYEKALAAKDDTLVRFPVGLAIPITSCNRLLDQHISNAHRQYYQLRKHATILRNARHDAFVRAKTAEERTSLNNRFTTLIQDMDSMSKEYSAYMAKLRIAKDEVSARVRRDSLISVPLLLTSRNPQALSHLKVTISES